MNRAGRGQSTEHQQWNTIIGFISGAFCFLLARASRPETLQDPKKDEMAGRRSPCYHLSSSGYLTSLMASHFWSLPLSEKRSFGSTKRWKHNKTTMKRRFSLLILRSGLSRAFYGFKSSRSIIISERINNHFIDTWRMNYDPLGSFSVFLIVSRTKGVIEPFPLGGYPSNSSIKSAAVCLLSGSIVLPYSDRRTENK